MSGAGSNRVRWVVLVTVLVAAVMVLGACTWWGSRQGILPWQDRIEVTPFSGLALPTLVPTAAP